MHESQPCQLEDLRIEIAPVVDDDDHARAGAKLVRRALEHLRHARDVLRDRRLRRSAAELESAEVLETEQLVRVAVLLVIVDQAWVRAGT